MRGTWRRVRMYPMHSRSMYHRRITAYDCREYSRCVLSKRALRRARSRELRLFSSSFHSICLGVCSGSVLVCLPQLIRAAEPCARADNLRRCRAGSSMRWRRGRCAGRRILGLRRGNLLHMSLRDLQTSVKPGGDRCRSSSGRVKPRGLFIRLR